tara:strand:+ start:5487 stop:6038 length:552 start_codon:yes stop_codon:yes gene_type:complete
MALSTIPTNMQSPLVASDIPAITAGMQPDGSVVQIVNTIYSNNADSGGGGYSIGASTSSVEIAGLRTTITPKLAGSHFLVQCNVMHGQSAGAWMHSKFSRDVNSTYQAEILEQSWYGQEIYGGGIDSKPWFNKVDTGATYTVGDTITYKFYANTQNGTTLTINWNNNGINNSTSSVTVMEIAQ